MLSLSSLWNLTYRREISVVVFAASTLSLSACAGANVASSTLSAQASINTPPSTVYVVDFELKGSDLQSQGLVARINHPMLLGRILPYSPLMIFSSKNDRAQHLATLMDQSLVNDLKERGFHAVRIASNATPPTSGWLVRGQFLSVNEGSRVKRSMIGFGAGHTSLEVRADVIDLTRHDNPKPMLDITTAARSGKTPGSVPGFNPATAAAGFALAGLDSDTDVKNSAVKISEEIVKRLLPSQLASRSVSPIIEKIHNL